MDDVSVGVASETMGTLLKVADGSYGRAGNLSSSSVHESTKS